MYKDIVYKEVPIDKISPRAIKVSIFTEGRTMPQGHKLEERYVYDYEIEFYTFSHGKMRIEDNIFSIEKGDIVFRRPGEVAQGIMPYTCYLLCFDMFGDTKKDGRIYDFHKTNEFQCHYKNDFLDSIPSIFHSSVENIYLNLFENLFREYINSNDGSSVIIKSYILQLLYQMYKDNKGSVSTWEIPRSPYSMQLKDVVQYMKTNLNIKIRLKDMAEIANLSPTYFHRVFTEAFNITPNGFLNRLRIERAKELLIKTSINISEVALECGFENIPYFSCAFKNHTGITPTYFRKKHNYM